MRKKMLQNKQPKEKTQPVIEGPNASSIGGRFALIDGLHQCKKSATAFWRRTKGSTNSLRLFLLVAIMWSDVIPTVRLEEHTAADALKRSLIEKVNHKKLLFDNETTHRCPLCKWSNVPPLTACSTRGSTKAEDKGKAAINPCGSAGQAMFTGAAPVQGDPPAIAAFQGLCVKMRSRPTLGSTTTALHKELLPSTIVP
jgi:hypothetical protein